jgi:hypothetical protein
MRLLVLGLAMCVAVGLSGLSPGRADEQAKKPPSDVAKEYAAIQKEWSEAQQAFLQAYRGAKTDAERQEILKDKRPKPAAFAERFLKLAEAHPDSTEARQALLWIATNARGTDAAKKALGQLKEKLSATNDLDQLQKSLAGLPAYGLGDLAPMVAEKARKNLDHPQAVPLLVWVCSATAYGPTKELAKLYNDTVDLLMDRFPERSELAPLTEWLASDDDPPWAEKHLRRLAEKNSSDEVKANARFALATALKNKDATSQPEAEKLLLSIIDEFAKKADKEQLVTRARKELDDIKLRGIGKSVPEIAGDDLDGKPLKLSDYKGKVVLLDFWGFW